MDKQELRTKLVAARRDAVAVDDPHMRHLRELAISSAGIEIVEQAAEPRSAIASYRALPSEPPTDLLNEALAQRGFQVLVPIHQQDGVYLEEMEWVDAVSGAPIARSTAEFRALAVPVVFTPALAAGRDGSRIGKGKGFYDRFFAGLPRHPGGPLRVAIVGPSELFESVPTDSHDESVDHTVVG